MQIIFNDSHPAVEAATSQANALLQNLDFIRAIAEHSTFDLSTATPKIIAEIISASSLTFYIELFHPNGLQALRYRKTFAMTDANHPNKLFLNDKKLNREVEDIAATIIHESIRALDDTNEEFTFGHGSNSSVGKENTAPYWIGNLAYKMLKKDPNAPLLAFDQEEMEETVG